MDDELSIRRVVPADRPAVIELCRISLGWRPEDPNEEFFAWKHEANPFGRSPGWVAVTGGGEIVGLRVFLRWRFEGPDRQRYAAVRAVDTATHPDWQGKGIFTGLTLGAIPDLRSDGIDFIFNTPNDKSRPGYLKMGWSQVGRVPTAVRPTSLGAVPRLLRSRTAADLWSTATEFGEDPDLVFADGDAVERLLARCARPRTFHTDVDAEYLRWRYSFAPLRYRVALAGDRIEDGLVVIRLRRRGEALECAVCEVLVPDAGARRRTLATVARATGADYLLRCVGAGGVTDGFVPLPQLGPILTWRPIGRTGVPRMGELALALGDVELF